jgi:inositol 3-alpha-galactosyltransferase
MSNFAYITLVTRSSYLAGVIVLSHSLYQQKSSFPLIVCYTPSLSSDCIQALVLESRHSNIILRPIETIQPASFSDSDLIAERFRDTWSKLRVFEPWNPPKTNPYTRLCYLDADMMLRQNLDFIFSTELPSPKWLVANHSCVCNRDADPWAPSTWNITNCAYTSLLGRAGMINPTPVPPTADLTTHFKPPVQWHTHTLLNSGLFLFAPSLELWNEMYDQFNGTSLATFKLYKFPDQDFLTSFFHNRWSSIGWHVNGLKTMRYWHPNIWRDSDVVNIHYIVDKPWAGPRPVKISNSPSTMKSDKGSDASLTKRDKNLDCRWSAVGYKGRDGETHSWWWATWDIWRELRESQDDLQIVEIVEQYVYGGKFAETEDMRSIGAGVQAFASNQNVLV